MESENQHIDPPGLLPKIFAGEATPEEKRLVEIWLTANPANRDEYDTLVRLWDLTGTVPANGDIDINVEWQKMESAITRTRILPLTRILQIAASVILVSALAFMGLKINGVRSERSPSTKLSSIVLPDGTALSLNAGSKVIYKKGFGRIHRVLVLKGEAYFEVKKNERLPFFIEAGESRIRVTGTKFNVRAYRNAGEIKVMVTEGRVQLYESGQPLKNETLSAGETGIYSRAERLVKKQPTTNMNDLAWKTRIMDFHNSTLSEVAGVLMNTYHIKIEIDPAIQHCSVTVRFENQELTSILAVLRSTLSLDLVTKGRHIVISGKGC